VERALSLAGCVAPDDEADALLAAAAAGRGLVDDLVARRTRGEPLAWIVGGVTFGGRWIAVDPGVFVPRPRSAGLAVRAAAALPADGIAIDLCTGSGAVAAWISAERPGARVVASDTDPAAVACARRNGVDALEGDLFAPVPSALRGQVDVVTAVTPYVPSDELRLLPRDVQAFEPPLALDGGPAGTSVIDRAIDGAATWLAPGGTLFVECGPPQIGPVRRRAFAAGFAAIAVHAEEDGEERLVEARRS